MNENNMLVMGLTGQSGAGKSTVSKMLADRGAIVLDADAIARKTIESSSQCLADLVLEYSTEIITPEANLNRARLAELCFSDPVKLKRLNDITYPHIIRSIEGRIEESRARGAKLLILDAPTLFESGLNKRCNRVIGVLADEQTRVNRIIARDSISESNARLRVNAQHDDAFYELRSDYIIRNDEDINTLRVTFLDVYGKIEREMSGIAPEEETDAADVQRHTPEQYAKEADARSNFEELADGE